MNRPRFDKAAAAALVLVGLGAIPRAWAEPAPAGPVYGDSSGIQTSLSVDIVGRAGRAIENRPDRLDVREAELVIYAPVDPVFDGLLNLAAHQEDDGAFFEVHEAYIGSTKLIPRSRFRLGQFFLGFGRLNQFHRHDWPFTSAPKVQREFFDTEGLNDTGLEYSILLPLPFYLDVTAGVTNGWIFGHSHDQGEPPLVPLRYVRVATYFDLPGGGGLQPALNYVGRKAADGLAQSYLGLDLTAKWREARVLRFFFQGEAWLRSLTPRGGATERTLGAYAFPQYAFDPSVSLGVRADYLTVLGLQDAVGASVSNATFAVVPTLTYKASEFSTLRASYTREWVSRAGATTDSSGLLELQAQFILGAHPAHEF